MILQALTEYYERKCQEGENSIAPPGMENQAIPFVIVLSENGQFCDIDDTRQAEGTNKQGRRFLVPQGVIKRTSGIKANLLWDKPSYVLGFDDNKKNVTKVKAQQEAFINRIIETFGNNPQDIGVRSVLCFLKNKNYDALYKHRLWKEIEKFPRYISFRLSDETELVCQRSAVIQKIMIKQPDHTQCAEQIICLITGTPDELAELHTAIKGVRDSQSSGASIVSFDDPAFRSYGKIQGANAPIGKKSMFAYTTALNQLLDKGSQQRMQIGDASTVFWAEKLHQMESLLVNLFDEVPKDDPGRRSEAIKSLFAAPKTGVISLDEDPTKFYVLGLSPNAARLAVRFWYVTPVSELASHIRRYFNDIALEDSSGIVEYPSIFRMLLATAPDAKSENIAPNLAGEIMQSILSGNPFPRTLLDAALRRIQHIGSKDSINHPLVALIKGYIVRLQRWQRITKEELKVSLDESNNNTAYCLGRLFAALERAQKWANPGINATIRERYYGAASSRPVTVFPLLLKLKNHHIAKLEHKGQSIFIEKLIGDIMSHLNNFPSYLDLADQGQFAVGYYHQRQTFFETTKQTIETSEGVKV